VETVTEFWDASVATAGDAPAVIFGDVVLSYPEVDARANDLARRLVAAGVGPDSLTAIAVPRSDTLIIAVLAVLKAGGAYLPLDPAYPAERLRHMVDDARPLLLLRTGDVAPLAGLPEMVLPTPTISADISPVSPKAGNLMYVIYTSGSTGVPKGVAVTHAGIADLVSTQQRVYGIRPGERVLQWASFSFDAWFWDFTMALMHGATLVMASPDDLLPGEALRETMLRYAVDHATLPPVALGITDSEGLLLDGTLTSTGDVCTQALAEVWSRGRRLFNGYGPTEVTVGTSVGGPVEGVQSEVSIGTPWDGSAVHVLDDRLRDGEDGELYLSGSGIARGYLNRPGLTATRFVADPYGPPGSRMYRSGDRGRRADDGRLYFTGRADHQVKVRGFRVELGEVEARLESHPAVTMAVVVLGDSAEHLVAYVTGAAEAAALREHVRAALPEHMVPSSVVVLDRMPTTLNGKVDRKALASRVDQPAPAGFEPAGSLEERLCGWVAETLRVGAVTPQDNFFDLGGHSVLAAKLASRMRKELGVAIPMRSVFESATLADLAASISRSHSTDS
jgi:amino acid adenylation domain-containing protein